MTKNKFLTCRLGIYTQIFNRNESTTLKVIFFVAEKTCQRQSDCVILKDCDPYRNLIDSMEKPLQPAIVDFLRSQECGFAQGYPMVCCSVFPKLFHALKNAQSHPKRPLNKLSADLPKKGTTFSTSTITMRTTTKTPSTTNRNLYNKANALDSAFMSEYFDYTGSFDLMLRIKRHNENNMLDIEIR